MELPPEEMERERRKVYDAVNKTRAKLGLEPIPFRNDPEPFYCSFCGKEPEAVAGMVGGVGVYICDECIRKSCELIDDSGN